MKKLETKYIVATIISIILGVSILGYGYMDYRYKKEALEQKTQAEEQEIRAKEKAKGEEEAEKIDKKQKYIECRVIVEEYKHELWNKECKSLGLKEDCNLPFANGERIEEWAEKETDNCFRLFAE